MTTYAAKSWRIESLQQQACFLNEKHLVGGQIRINDPLAKIFDRSHHSGVQISML
jgi:hypothetical protein